MMMTDAEHKALRAYCAHLLKEHGFHYRPTDPIIPALYIIYKEHRLSIASMEATALLIKEAANGVKPQAFHFHTSDAAFQYQIGGAVKWMLNVLVISIVVGLATWVWSVTNREDKSKGDEEFSFIMKGLRHQIQRDKNGIYFLDFTASKGDSIQYFKEYRRIDKKTIRVPLGKKGVIKRINN